MSDALAHAIRTVPDFPSPGIRFKDLTPILADAVLFGQVLDRLVEPFDGLGVTHVVGIEARGFWFGPALAQRLGAGFVPARKPGKLPAERLSETYALEYGTDTLELHADALASAHGAARVLVHDDVIATGGTAAAACALVERAGGEVVACSFVMELGFLNGRARLPDGMRVETALSEA
jgi:adenine phosphoribosyltransferase